MFKPSFLGKVALVTGASRGIGAATALELARRGSQVILASRDEGRLAEVAQRIISVGIEADVIPVDVTDPLQVKNGVAQTIQKWGRLDILISNAGEYIRSPIWEMEIEDVRRSMEVNFYAGLSFVQAVLPVMQEQGNGHIVFITSVDGKKGLPMDAPYVSAKFALTGFAEVLRQELKNSGIHVCNVLPGRVDTAMIERLRVPAISAKIPPEVVARAVISAIEKRKVEVILPFNAKLLCYVNAFFPRLADWVADVFHLEGWET
jgi:NAD(P)-dependent dehydrogenase (short-subunit alcohol dehydrogenase family)